MAWESSSRTYSPFPKSEHDYSFMNPSSHKREHSKRIFVNRNLILDKIKFYGFDMDYTLAMYKSPQYDKLAFDLSVKFLINMGYPPELMDIKYDPSFPMRGLWFDINYGTMLKVDPYGNILLCCLGFDFLKINELRKLYPNNFVMQDESRFFIMNTLFSLADVFLLSCIIEYFLRNQYAVRKDDGFLCNHIFMSYRSIFEDVRLALDSVHNDGSLKKATLENIGEYIAIDEKLPLLLNRIRRNDRKIFLLTNSDYEYTEKVMTYLFDIESVHKEQKVWKQYFDYIFTSARKPLFFSSGTLLRQVNEATGSLCIGSYCGPHESGIIYAGGSVADLQRLFCCKGKEVLYVGDHIFGDILKTKKIGWRTFLIVPELTLELNVWIKRADLFEKLNNLNIELAEMYINMDSETQSKPPEVSSLRSAIRSIIHEMDMSYGLLGSLFRSGSRQTFFASQVTRFADIYASSPLNLLYYPLFYFFNAPDQLMPHELTVEQHQDDIHTPNADEVGEPHVERDRSVLYPRKISNVEIRFSRDPADMSYGGEETGTAENGTELLTTCMPIPKKLTQIDNEASDEEDTSSGSRLS